jgi:hypothetical protein
MATSTMRHNMSELLLTRFGTRALSIAMAIGLACGPLHAQSERTARIMAPEKGKPLASRLLPGDKVVDLMWIQSEPLTASGPVGPMPRVLNILMNTYDSLALIDIVDVSAFETPELGWIRRKANSSVVEVFKRGQIPESDRIQLVLDGGELNFGSVVVRTDRYAVLTPGTRYLVALRFDRELKGLTLAGFWARRGQDGRIVAMEQSTGIFIETSLQDQVFDDLVKELRRRAY